MQHVAFHELLLLVLHHLADGSVRYISQIPLLIAVQPSTIAASVTLQS